MSIIVSHKTGFLRCCLLRRNSKERWFQGAYRYQENEGKEGTNHGQ